jgi:hypothetical protein
LHKFFKFSLKRRINRENWPLAVKTSKKFEYWTNILLKFYYFCTIVITLLYYTKVWGKILYCTIEFQIRVWKEKIYPKLKKSCYCDTGDGSATE